MLFQLHIRTDDNEAINARELMLIRGPVEYIFLSVKRKYKKKTVREKCRKFGNTPGI